MKWTCFFAPRGTSYGRIVGSCRNSRGSIPGQVECALPTAGHSEAPEHQRLAPDDPLKHVLLRIVAG